MAQKKQVLGLDPGTTNVGYGVVFGKSNDATPKTYGKIKSEETPQFHRLETFFQEVTELLSDVDPDVVVIEEAFYGPDAKTTLRLGQVRGVLALSALQNDSEVVEYSPSEIKKSVTGNGRAGKRQVKQMVRSLLQLQGQSLSGHASDALAACLCYFHRKKLDTRIS